MNISKVGRRGQISIPRMIRQALNLQAGDRLAFIRRGDEFVLQPLKQTLSDFRGSVAVSAPQDFDAIRQQVLDRHTYRTVTDDD
jgi:AbrB family looped-hinge helix DNA binding protein